jgi:hypothetical protein
VSARTLTETFDASSNEVGLNAQGPSTCTGSQHFSAIEMLVFEQLVNGGQLAI